MSIAKPKRDKIRKDIMKVIGAEYEYTAVRTENEIDAVLKKHFAPGRKTSSVKSKGRRAQQWLRDRIRVILDNVWGIDDPDHVDSRGMGQSGADIILSPTAKIKFPFACEVKNVEKIGFWPTVEQALANTGSLHPLIMFQKNHSKPWIAVEADVFLAQYEKLCEYSYLLAISRGEVSHVADFNMDTVIKQAMRPNERIQEETT